MARNSPTPQVFPHYLTYCILSTKLYANNNSAHDRETLDVLATHATIKARKNYSAPESFYRSFSQFCDRLYDSGWPNDYLSVAEFRCLCSLLVVLA